MMALKNFLCGKCGILIKSKTKPSDIGCKKGGNFHSWRNLGEEGEKTFHCTGCLIRVNLKDTPTKFGCSKKEYHTWEILP